MADDASSSATESMTVAALLTLTGGFLDAFSYVGHGRVFANSMTGNIVFLGIALADRDPQLALHRLLPLLAFVAGVLLAHLVRLSSLNASAGRAARLALIIEVGMLFWVSLLPEGFPDTWIILGIAFTAALQSTIFGRLNGHSYNSTMMTGNLRRFAELFFAGLIPHTDRPRLRQAGQLGVICGVFLLGALLGAGLTPVLHNRCLLVPILALFSLLWMSRRTRGKEDRTR